MLSTTLRTNVNIEGVIETYADMLVRVAFTYLKNRPDAEDVAQDAFLKLMEKKPSFESTEHEKAWLIRVSINLCKNRLKSAWFRKRIPFDETVSGLTPQESELLGTILEMPVKYRSIILLFYYERYSIAEIADILSLKESTVGSQLYRARQILKEILKEDFGDA